MPGQEPHQLSHLLGSPNCYNALAPQGVRERQLLGGHQGVTGSRRAGDGGGETESGPTGILPSSIRRRDPGQRPSLKRFNGSLPSWVEKGPQWPWILKADPPTTPARAFQPPVVISQQPQACAVAPCIRASGHPGVLSLSLMVSEMARVVLLGRLGAKTRDKLETVSNAAQSG